MILIDSSVWIDYFNGAANHQTDWLDAALGKQAIITGDLILAEVLQGFQKDSDFKAAKSLLLKFPVYSLCGKDLALESAANYRFLRKKGRYRAQDHGCFDWHLLHPQCCFNSA